MAYCSQCAEPLASEARFCHKCGAAAAATAPNATIIGAPLPVAAKKPRPVAKILGALIGLGVLCALAYLGGGKPVGSVGQKSRRRRAPIR